MTASDKIFRAIERITGKTIICFHDEANRYAFKFWATEEWATLDRAFVDERTNGDLSPSPLH
jgi:hypothetical protein